MLAEQRNPNAADHGGVAPTRRVADSTEAAAWSSPPAPESLRALAPRLLALLLSALTLGLTFAHVLELPQRLRYDAQLWTSLTRPNALYRYIGLVGGPLEVAAVVVVAAFGFVAWRRRVEGRRLVLAAAVLHAAALACWIAVVAPANVEIGRWAASGIPADWQRWRSQWEAGHAAGFVLLLCGFCSLVLGLLSDRRRRA